jgi:hypothetical protein
VEEEIAIAEGKIRRRTRVRNIETQAESPQIKREQAVLKGLGFTV